jgi:dolichol-phosphate mannosyltransferase
MTLPYNKKSVTAIIPAKNEGKGLERIIPEVKKYAADIIVVDGHSTDNTKQIAENAGVNYLLDNGKGRGDGVRLGITKAKNEVIVLVDADGSHEIADIPSLVLPLIKDRADMVISSRRTGGSSDMEMNFDRLLRSAGSIYL